MSLAFERTRRGTNGDFLDPSDLLAFYINDCSANLHASGGFPKGTLVKLLRFYRGNSIRKA